MEGIVNRPTPSMEKGDWAIAGVVVCQAPDGSGTANAFLCPVYNKLTDLSGGTTKAGGTAPPRSFISQGLFSPL
jgi:hypothetical protein